MHIKATFKTQAAPLSSVKDYRATFVFLDYLSIALEFDKYSVCSVQI